MTKQTITEADIEEVSAALSGGYVVVRPWAELLETRLPNGARVVAWALLNTELYVLAVFHGREFVSWHVDPKNHDCYSGQYYRGYTPGEVVEKFRARVPHHRAAMIIPA